MNFQTRKRKPKGMKNSDGTTSKSSKSSTNAGKNEENQSLLTNFNEFF